MQNPMKKTFCVVLCLFFIANIGISYSDPISDQGESIYSPALSMTMDQFISKYNALGSSLNSSLVALKNPYFWSTFEDYLVGWFKADSKAETVILLMTKETEKGKTTFSGLDKIQIYSPQSQILSLITVSTRCTSLFSEDLFGTSLASLYVGNLLEYYYENCPEDEGSAYRGIDSDSKNVLQFFKSDGYYFFDISPYATVVPQNP